MVDKLRHSTSTLWLNISVIDTVNNAFIGTPLKTWQFWPVNNPGPDRDDLYFSVAIPENLDDVCTEGGRCALQWYWRSISNSQTHESCVDFIVS
ncbi:hypothetical protein S40293_11131 [Stachybotrys chartarum IBT 40293]|nr:hypothetical protein S40293_11131 [Stachybotrys chartarum IBT 40293]